MSEMQQILLEGGGGGLDAISLEPFFIILVRGFTL